MVCHDGAVKMGPAIDKVVGDPKLKETHNLHHIVFSIFKSLFSLHPQDALCLFRASWRINPSTWTTARGADQGERKSEERGIRDTTLL